MLHEIYKEITSLKVERSLVGFGVFLEEHSIDLIFLDLNLDGGGRALIYFEILFLSPFIL